MLAYQRTELATRIQMVMEDIGVFDEDDIAEIVERSSYAIIDEVIIPILAGETQ